MIFTPKIVIYDLDGTIIDTTKLHEDGWQHAFNELGKPNKVGKQELPEGFMLYQKGRSGDFAAKYIYGDSVSEEVLKAFRKIKKDYVEDKIGDSPIFPGFIDANDYIMNKGCLVWICTSASASQVDSVFEENPDLTDRLNGNVVLKGMFKESKPSPECLFVTLRMAGGFRPDQGLYVGDAHPDYMSAKNAGTGFVYFCPPTETIDDKIPSDVIKIQHHIEITDVLKF